MKSYYDVLGVDRNASPDAIKRAYRKLASLYHPDKEGGSKTKFQEVEEAYRTLGDPDKRQQYDNPSPFGHHGFAGFQNNTPQLITLGGISLISQMLILGVMMLTGGATLVSILMSGKPVDNPEILAQAIVGAGLALTLGMGLFSVLLMAM